MMEVKEVKVNVPEGQLISTEIKDGVCTLRFEVEEKVFSELNVEEEAFETAVNEPKIFYESEIEEIFVLVEASKLSLTDDFMKYRPKNIKEWKFKMTLKSVIRKGISDFWCMRMDPFLIPGTGDRRPIDFNGIDFKKEPVPLDEMIETTCYNWFHIARELCPKRYSRLGTKSQYIAFLGVLIKRLVEDGRDVDEAWNIVCNDSTKLTCGEELKLDNRDFYGITKTFKIITSNDRSECWLAGGYFKTHSDPAFRYTLADLEPSKRILRRAYYSVGWIVLNK